MLGAAHCDLKRSQVTAKIRNPLLDHLMQTGNAVPGENVFTPGQMERSLEIQPELITSKGKQWPQKMKTVKFNQVFSAH